jgi:hypothetical protein
MLGKGKILFEQDRFEEAIEVFDDLAERVHDADQCPDGCNREPASTWLSARCARWKSIPGKLAGGVAWVVALCL